MSSRAELAPFWRLLESRPRAVAVLREWQDCGDACFRVVEPLLQPRHEAARTFPCGDPLGNPLTIVRHPDGQIVAVDEEDPSRRLELARADVVLYELHLAALRGALCSALGLTIARTPLTPPARDVLLGSWEPQRAVRLPVRCLFPYGEHQLEELVHRRLAADNQTGAMLFTPTRRLWREPLYEAARRQKLLLVPLCEVLAAGDEGFCATASWHEYRQAFLQMVKAAFPASCPKERPRRKRAERAAKIERIRQALVDHFRSARDHAFATAQRGDGAALLPRPSKTILARMAGVQPHDITRCFHDDPQLVRLYAMADNLEDVMRFGR